MLQKHPEDRPELSTLLNHDFFKHNGVTTTTTTATTTTATTNTTTATTNTTTTTTTTTPIPGEVEYDIDIEFLMQEIYGDDCNPSTSRMKEKRVVAESKSSFSHPYMMTYGMIGSVSGHDGATNATTATTNNTKKETKVYDCFRHHDVDATTTTTTALPPGLENYHCFSNLSPEDETALVVRNQFVENTVRLIHIRDINAHTNVCTCIQ